VYYKSEGANHDSGAIDPFISLSLVMYCTPDPPPPPLPPPPLPPPPPPPPGAKGHRHSMGDLNAEGPLKLMSQGPMGQVSQGVLQLKRPTSMPMGGLAMETKGGGGGRGGGGGGGVLAVKVWNREGEKKKTRGDGG